MCLTEVMRWMRRSVNVLDVGDEMDEKQQLDEQMRAVMDKYKYKRRQIRELQEDLQVCYWGWNIKEIETKSILKVFCT